MFTNLRIYWVFIVTTNQIAIFKEKWTNRIETQHLKPKDNTKPTNQAGTRGRPFAQSTKLIKKISGDKPAGGHKEEHGPTQAQQQQQQQQQPLGPLPEPAPVLHALCVAAEPATPAKRLACAHSDARAQAFGSCTQVLATAITALFRAINAFGIYQQESADKSTTRSAKLLYVQLLDRAQRERGEWRGFGDTCSSSSGDSSDAQQKKPTTASDILATHLHNLSRDETFALLNELVDVSFRSIRGPLVSAELYVKHKKSLAALSLGIPVSLPALLEIRAILNELGRDEKLCAFRLLTLWHAMAVANEAQDLRRTIHDKHHLVFSDCSELEFLTTLRDPRHDAVAIALLQILVLYHDVLFSDVEVSYAAEACCLFSTELACMLTLLLRRLFVEIQFLQIKQELQLSESLTGTRVASGEPSDSESTLSESKAADAAAQVEISSPVRDSQVEEPARPDMEEDSRSSSENPEGEMEERSHNSPASHNVNSSINESDLLVRPDAPSLPDSQAEQSAACEDKYATPEHAPAVVVEDTPPPVLQAPAELSFQQQKPREQVAAPPQADAVMATPDAQIHSHTTTEHHARAHGPVVSIRPHSLSPRKSKASKRFAFEPPSVNTTSPSPGAKQPHHRSPKVNGTRQATRLWDDVVHIADYFGNSSASEKQQYAQTNEENSKPQVAQLLIDISATAVAVVRCVEQQLPVPSPSKAPPAALPPTTRSASANSETILDVRLQERDKHVSKRDDGCSTKSTSPPSARRRRCSSSSSPPLYEVTDLANTYFSFSFAAATLRTMAIMAVYAIRRHQHQQQ